jgi:hypothetical protein
VNGGIIFDTDEHGSSVGVGERSKAFDCFCSERPLKLKSFGFTL